MQFGEHIIHAAKERLKDNDIMSAHPSNETLLRIFFEVFSALSGDDRKDVSATILVDGLIRTAKFTEDTTIDTIKKSMQNGQIYGRKAGYYTKA
jgi:replicative DNA helicase Mcm